MAVLESADHRGLVDDLPARGVDDDGALLELADERLADVALGLRAERDVHAEHVRLREHLVDTFSNQRSPNKLKVSIDHTADWWLGDLDGPWFHALETAVQAEWGVEPLRIREGGVRRLP